MVHWKEIEQKHNKLVNLLKKKGIIDGIEAIKLHTIEYNLQKLKICYSEEKNAKKRI